MNSNYLINQQVPIEEKVARLDSEIKYLKSKLCHHFNTIVLPYKGTKRIIAFDTIIMIVACSNYAEILLESGEKILTSRTLKHWESILTSDDFVRVHASYLINRRHILSIHNKEHKVQMTNGSMAKLSRNRHNINASVLPNYTIIKEINL
ncbi:MAG: LytTR family transcriptional regulator [Saprospiraceae bacterium]|nr:LytTR family transcriptional regulator [Saprospiraceae bacterium]